LTLRHSKWLLRLLLAALVVAPVAVAASLPEGSAADVSRTATADPLSKLPFFVQKNLPAAVTERSYLASGYIADAHLMGRLAGQPEATWLTGPSSLSTLSLTLRWARAQHQLPTYVLYDIPGRDCGSYSRGGAASPSAYRAWVRQIAARIGSTPVVLVIEPDALPEMTCWSGSEQATAYELIGFDAATFASKPNATVYIDAGDSTWQSVQTMVVRLRRAGVSRVRGFALNVAAFETTAASLAYGKRIARALGGKHFVIDTGRNGRGAPAETGPEWWCNPPGRGIGPDPTTRTGSPLADAYLWIKPPGESDGSCNGGPTSGDWWPAYALGLAERAYGQS
jgi:endoglucanase